VPKKNDASLKFYLKKSPDDENRRRKEKLREKKKSLCISTVMT